MADAVPPPNELPKHCYMDISVAGSPPETVVFELDTATCPKTSWNFASLCAAPGKAVKPKGRGNFSSASASPIATYRNTEFHRIKPLFIVQGGDFENFDGTGGRSIFSTATFDDESFANKHNTEGVISMANRGTHTNSSQFFITLGNASHLDGKHVAFGRVVRGMDVVRQIATVETENDRPIPMQRVVVVDCGIGMGSGSGSPKEDSKALKDEKSKKEKQHRKHSRRDRSNSSSSSSDSWSSDDSSHHHKSKKHKKRRRGRSRSRSRDRERSSASKRHSHKERKRSKKKHKHRSRHRERDDRKHRRRSRSRSR